MDEEDLFYEKLKEQYEEDLKWDYKTASSKLNNISVIYSKYLRYWYKLKAKMEESQKEADDTWSARWLHYKMDFDVSLTSAEIKMFLDKDPKLNELRYKALKYQTRCEAIEKMMKNLDAIRWDIKTYIEFEKLRNGQF